MLVTRTGPVRSLQPVTKGWLGSTTISLSETEMMIAGRPASVTATGDWKPCPKIVTGVNGRSTRCSLLETAVICTGWTYRYPSTSVVSRPDVALRTRTSTVWFRLSRPAPNAAGVRTTIWLKATETIVASTSPKKTWRGAWKPAPRIVTRVFPSFVPDAGRTAVIVGVVDVVVPKAKQFGRVRIVGVAVLLARVTRISTGVVGDVTSGNPGVRTSIESPSTETTVASRTTPLTMKATRVVAASPPVQPEVGQNRPPRMDRAVPPVEGPKLGSQKLTNGPAPAAAGWNWIVMVAVPVSPPEVEVARTTAVPGNSEQRAVTAAPFWVTTEMRGSAFCAKTPKSVENETLVPSGTGLPLSVTTAWINVHVPAGGFGLLVKSRIWSALEGPLGPGPVGGPALGGVGASDEQRKLPATSARTVRVIAIRRMKASVSVSSRPLETACAREEKKSRSGFALDPMPGNGPSEEGEVEGQADLLATRLPIDAAVERQQLVERGLLEVPRVHDRKVRERRFPAGGHEDSGAERLRRGDPSPAIGPAEPHRVAVDLRVREPLGIALAQILQPALELDLLDLNGSRNADVHEPRLELEADGDEDGSFRLPLVVRTARDCRQDEEGRCE